MKIKLDHKYETVNGNVVKIVYCCHGSSYPHIGYVVSKKKTKKREYHSWSNYGMCCNSNVGLTFKAFSVKEPVVHERANDTDGGEWANRTENTSWQKEGTVAFGKSVTGNLVKSADFLAARTPRVPVFVGFENFYLKMWIDVKEDYDIFPDISEYVASIGDIVTKIDKDTGKAEVYYRNMHGYQRILASAAQVPLNGLACIAVCRIEGKFYLYINGDDVGSVNYCTNIGNISLANIIDKVRTYIIALTTLTAEQVKSIYASELQAYSRNAFAGGHILQSL